MYIDCRKYASSEKVERVGYCRSLVAHGRVNGKELLSEPIELAQIIKKGGSSSGVDGCVMRDKVGLILLQV